MELLRGVKLVPIGSFKHADIYLIQDYDTVLVQATTTYIPISSFKTIFTFISDLVKKNKVEKLVFDKRKLTVFHQPSMEWYFTEWKEEMFKLGLSTHRKLLPNDIAFRQSVKIGREKIEADHPQGKFHMMDIKYFENLEEAIEK